MTRSRRLAYAALALLLPLLVLLSLAAGGQWLNPLGYWQHDASAQQVLLISRLPRTLSLLIAGAAMSIAGVLMQLLTQNRYVEPATAGTIASASLGLLLTALFWPSSPLLLKMLIASLFALLGSALFIAIIQRLKLLSPLLVPVIGLMLSAVIGALTTFIAVRFELLQALNAWLNGDFSSVLQGRYELLWLTAAIALVIFVVAERFAVAGMGYDVATNLGLNYHATQTLGLALVSVTTAVVVVVVGALPFLGLIVPNLISLAYGDQLRANLPLIALTGAALTMACDILGRVLIAPFEIPVGTLLGVIGALLFLWVLRQTREVAR
ncbi:ABC transporter permease [Idiomarina xiamenensis]|uniref:Petrobactin ABC transporter permease I n=1 Tax=Idiomarina xiamenensis 10-D-4 TaxID=740709 RepID=K2K381_9GAMM|nr:iron chelate uptake ABC transporter family permease subunit [Idiomarina xiamenensis]EKE82078.1 petrobactin ABC transporter permease I [Idiomarina xiamenensis 10-D-4]